MHDALYTVRRLRLHPGYTLLAVLTLALGIGGTAATFGVARAVLFDPLPYQRPGEIGTFWKKTDWTEEEFLFIRGRVPGFQQVALYRQRDVILRSGDGPARLVPGVAASSELFDVLGVRPVLGRGFQVGDDVPGAEPVAVLSFGLWQQAGANPSIVGTRMTFDGTPRTVIGVMPRGFWFPDPSVRVWTSVALRPEGRSWNSTLVGRVAPDQDVRAMDAPVARLTTMLDERFDYPPQWEIRKNARITPVRDDMIGPIQPALFATLGAMTLILLIACANVAALMLGQVDGRSVEFAVRSALGASRRRLTQPLIIEALLIATVAGALGAALAWTGYTILTRALPLGAWGESAIPDWRVFLAAMAIAIGAALLVMLVPTISLYRSDLLGVLSSARTGGIRGRGGRLENVLVVAEVALAVMIAAGAALLGRSVANLYAVHPGIRTDGLAVVDMVFGNDLNRAGREHALAELMTALRGLPGVESVGAVQQLPLRGGGYRVGIGFNDPRGAQDIVTEYRIVTSGYLESAGFVLRQGRMIADTDQPGTERVVVINEALAHKYFAGIDPIGKLVGGDVNNTSSRIVGVVADAVETRLSDPVPPVRYVALAQMPWMDYAQSLVLRASRGVDAASLLESARRTIDRMVPTAAVQQTTTMGRVVDTAIGPARPVVVLLSVLTGIALTLGAVGIYGVIAHFAARRRRDWAIRVALGLPGSRVITQVVAHGLLLVAAGIAVGALGAAAITRLLSSLLYGVSAIDPMAFALAGAALLCVGVLAAIVPAWRAGMADPVIALRE
jgi:putative ABC transport system permease protein